MNDREFEALLSYIDEHIEEPFRLNEIAGRFGYSSYHFSKLFAYRMDQPPMEYVRSRKLQHAIVPLLRGERVLDIALRFGFESHEGFTRAFKREYSMPPQSFRGVYRGAYRVPPRRSFHSDKGSWIRMQVRIEKRPTKTIVAYRLHTEPGSAEIARFWQEVMQDDRWQRLFSKAAGDNYGICLVGGDIPEGHMDYLLGFDYDGSSPLDEDMELFNLEAAEYAVFPAPISEDKPMSMAIKEAWSYAYTQWLPQSEYVYAEGCPDFELYPSGEACDVFIPVRKR